LNEGLKELSLDARKVIAAFNHYLAHEGTSISRANAEERMLNKLTRSLTDDIAPMLAAGVAYGDDEALEAFERVWFVPNDNIVSMIVDRVATRHLGLEDARAEFRKALAIVEPIERRDPIDVAHTNVRSVAEEAYFYAGVAFGVTLATAG